ncbi:MAG: hypothetical protein CMM30_03200 [Rhodospirillaceae bacterium]|nr:hypothetical protein [Rhodospirillaceae bacterium]
MNDLHQMKFTKNNGIIASTLCMIVILSACGFEPVYKNAANHSIHKNELNSELNQISIDTIPGRVGHQLRKNLVYKFGSNSNLLNQKYNLVINLDSDKSPLLIQDDEKVSRYNLSLIASFMLADSNSKTIYEGHARSVGSFNVVTSEFATLMAERDAEDRAASELSAEINGLLIDYFARKIQ